VNTARTDTMEMIDANDGVTAVLFVTLKCAASH
jgi:hypothetical protein